MYKIYVEYMLKLISELSTGTSPTGTKAPPMIVWTNSLPRYPSDIKKPKVVTVF